MSTLQKINNQIAGARKKVRHAVSSVQLAERRCAYWRQRRAHHSKGDPGWRRCNRKVNYWSAVLKRALQAQHAWRLALNRRIRKKRRYLKKHPPQPATPTAGLTMVDGRRVVNWIAGILAAARASGRWRGSVISGYRTPEESEQICIHQVCGRPYCPGTCAGRLTNHACPPDGKPEPWKGAVDVTDAAGLRAYCTAHNLPLRGGGQVLSRDIPHFSHEGN